MTLPDTLSPEAGQQLFEDLGKSGVLKLRLEMTKNGKPVTGTGFADHEMMAVQVLPPDGRDPILMAFPTCMFAHRWARFMDLGPRPTVITEGGLSIRRGDLDRADRRSTALEDAPRVVRESLDRDDSLRWSLTLHDNETRGQKYSKTLEVYDCGEGGIWLLLAPLLDDDTETVVAIPADGTTIWRALITLLPAADEWMTLVSR